MTQNVFDQLVKHYMEAGLLSFSLLVQVTSCSWWLPMSSDTPWACPTPAILARSCSPCTPTATPRPSSSQRTTSEASSPSMVKVEVYAISPLFLPRTLTFTCLGPNPKGPVGPGPKPPTTPDACDSELVLDAVTTLRGEIYFFKGR